MNESVRLACGVLLLFVACWYCCSYRSPSAMLGDSPRTPEAAAVAATQPVSFEAQFQPGQVTLRGVLPNAAARERVLAQAQALSGGPAIVAPALQTNGAVAGAADSGEAWLTWVLAVLPLGQQLNQAGVLQMTADEVTVRGVVPTQAARSQLLQQVTARLPGTVKLNDLLVLADNPLNEQELQAQAQLNQILLKGIEFASGKAGISTASAETLTEAAVLLRDAPSVQLEIGGHTDNQGDAGANTGLSQIRAQAVKKFLSGQGVAPARMTVKGYGAAQPIADNNSEAGRQRNRRIEFRLRGGNAADNAPAR
jgi:OOP family OmpA-OmpF porin